LEIKEAGDNSQLGSGHGFIGLKEAVGQLISKTRQICHNMRPPVLDLGLVPSIRSLIHEHKRQSDFDIRLTIEGNRQQVLDKDITLCLFRFTQEALNNVRKHANARQVRVFLRIAEELSLTIEDDGCGFVLPKCWTGLMSDQHFGLIGLRERVELLNGTLQIISAPKEGTRLQAYVPLN